MKRENIFKLNPLNNPLFCHFVPAVADRLREKSRLTFKTRSLTRKTGFGMTSTLFCNNSGQALVENVLVIPIIVVIIVMLFWFAEIMLTKQQLVMAARYGTDLMAYSNLSKEQIRNEIRDYLCGSHVEGRRLNPAKLKVEDIDVKRQALDPLGGIKYGGDGFDKYSSHVQLYYEFDAPPLFYSFAKYFGGSNMARKLRIGARSEVLAGTGCQGDN